MAYKRNKPYNEIKQEHLKKIEIHLKFIEDIKNGNINKRKNNTM